MQSVPILDKPLDQALPIARRILPKLKKLGITTIRDLLLHVPTRYEDFSKIVPIATLKPEENATIQGNITDKLFHVEIQKQEEAVPALQQRQRQMVMAGAAGKVDQADDAQRTRAQGERRGARAGNSGDQAAKAETVRRERPKVGRNDPCPCGSGKKYKKCHGRDEAEAANE